MCRNASRWVSRAMAAVTQESMPPLTRTTAVGSPDAVIFFLPHQYTAPAAGPSLPFPGRSQPAPSIPASLDAPCGRVPDELVKLQAQPDGQPILENPLRQLRRSQPRPATGGISEHRREDHLVHPPGQAMLEREGAGELVIPAAGNDELHFILRPELVEIGRIEPAAFAESGHLTSTIRTTPAGSTPMK